MQAKSKLFGLTALCLGYMAIMACGGGGGGEGGGAAVQAQAECYPTPSKCRDGSDAVKNDSASWGVADPIVGGVRKASSPNGDKASCAYICGGVSIKSSTTETNTVTTTATQTETVTAH